MDKDRIRFAHFSDTHILRSYDTKASKGWIEAGLDDPTLKLKETLEFAVKKYKDLDFVILSGDMVHEGSVQDYSFLRDILKDILGSIPVFAVMGNHDKREAFYEGFENRGKDRVNDEPYYYEQEVKGLRIIGLDSLVYGKTTGEVSEDQIIRLKETLKTSPDKGNIIVIHHPLAMDIREGMLNHSLLNADKLKDVLNSSNIRAVFAGHIHADSTLMLNQTPVFTTAGTAFGVDIDDKNIYYLKKASFNYCEITKDEIFVKQHNIPEITPLSVKI